MAVKLTSLDNRLDGLVNVVVDVLASNDGSNSVGVGGSAHDALVLKLSSLLSETSLNLTLVAVVE